jgi:hypothetical protein
MRAWLRLADDLLGDPPVDTQPHPHRRPLRWEHQRRPGAVPHRYAHCISPIRPASERAQTERVRATTRG